jgi:hypothetical protein
MMNKSLLGMGLLLILSSPSAFAAPPPPDPNDSQELLTLMRETQSVDTFLTALECLAATDPHCKGLLPSAIRNADRLGLLKGRVSGKPTEAQESYNTVMNELFEARGHEKVVKPVSSASLTLPSPRYLEHPPQYIAPTPAAGPGVVIERIEHRLLGPETKRQEHPVPVPLGCCVPWLFGVRLINAYSPDPNVRINQLLNQSEDSGPVGYQWQRIWFNDQPQHLTPERVHGGIMP